MITFVTPTTLIERAITQQKATYCSQGYLPPAVAVSRFIIKVVGYVNETVGGFYLSPSPFRDSGFFLHFFCTRF
ncbi:hypothetical protein EZS27_026330 [termite gut metagenome]|uniref:Uncharacterized protein n=1 Tax=termite gut metagenome TaxID=433724 RepID=A0A5J4QUS8_9ZZZZ